jgi:ATP-dependent DNA helicase RecG
MTIEEFQALVYSLIGLPKETEWVEFKQNKAVPEEVGQYISALANSAALHGKISGYIVWGIEDGSHEIVGTSFKPKQQKKGNEEFENWLIRLLEPRIDVKIHEGNLHGKRLVIFEVQPATYLPIRFNGAEYIRIGSYTKKLKDYPEKERALWTLFSRKPFENGTAISGISSADVLDLIDYPTYFRLMSQTLPENRRAILERLSAERIIVNTGSDRFDICNVGAILFAYDLTKFDLHARKAPRVIIYRGTNRIDTIREQPGGKGYAVGFEGLIDFINDKLPENEEVGKALRREVRMYPKEAIRELVANALIHQDLNLTGTGPLVEIFDDRIEITNPGIPLIDPRRFIDEPPRSRNEILAKLMRRMKICEERGSGIDKVISSVELFQLPAPDFRVTPNHTIAVLFGPRDFSEMDKEDRIRACYQHACLMYVSNKRMTNESLRKRLNIADSNYTAASRIIRDTIEAELIKPYDLASSSKKHAKYIPYWA